MAEYYCLMAGAPDLSLDSQGKAPLGVEDFWQECKESLSERDLRLLSLFFLREDCLNMARLLSDPQAEIVEPAGMTREDLSELILSAQEMNENVDTYPAFMQDFVREYPSHAGDATWRAKDQILLLYYQYAGRCRNRTVAAWFRWNLNVTNLLTALIARRQGWNVGDYILGEDEVNEMIRTSRAKDFDLAKLYEFADGVLRIAETTDPVEKERGMDVLRWQWLDEATVGNEFGVEAVFAYLCKLDMLARWDRLNPEMGKETFRSIIENLRSSAQVPEEFVLKNPYRKTEGAV